MSAANGRGALGRKPIQTVGRVVDVVRDFGFAEAETKAVHSEYRTDAKTVSYKRHGIYSPLTMWLAIVITRWYRFHTKWPYQGKIRWHTEYNCGLDMSG